MKSIRFEVSCCELADFPKHEVLVSSLAHGVGLVATDKPNKNRLTTTAWLVQAFLHNQDAPGD